MEHQASMDRERLRLALTQEDALFEADHPRSLEMFERARSSLLAGVPMPWMTQWAGRFPIFVETAEGARFTDVDGNSYVDFCLGDTGAMTGHSPASVADAISEQAHRGITTMLPTPDALAVSQDLA
ncbi:MAG: glutamate-semialdehyde -aminomutase, partial [Actinomycetota bacterium]|nr:glutamate-semialdehyde -aminomutase [Actinomycetota bacterium]